MANRGNRLLERQSRHISFSWFRKQAQKRYLFWPTKRQAQSGYRIRQDLEKRSCLSDFHRRKWRSPVVLKTTFVQLNKHFPVGETSSPSGPRPLQPDDDTMHITPRSRDLVLDSRKQDGPFKTPDTTDQSGPPNCLLTSWPELHSKATARSKPPRASSALPMMQLSGRRPRGASPTSGRSSVEFSCLPMQAIGGRVRR